jgi:hypothetical protein
MESGEQPAAFTELRSTCFAAVHLRTDLLLSAIIRRDRDQTADAAIRLGRDFNTAPQFDRAKTARSLGSSGSSNIAGHQTQRNARVTGPKINGGGGSSGCLSKGWAICDNLPL